MLRLQRRKCPKILRTKGLAKTKELCALYDRSEPHRKGEERFSIDAETYGDLSVRKVLERAQRGKCGYCDAKMLPLDIEHYRPKSASKQARTAKDEKPGYYWLSYEWQNLLLACVFCNQSRQDTAGEPTGKGTLFPLINPTKRARSHHDSLAPEEPLLLHPYEDDPDEHIGYRQYRLHALTKKGEATIEVLKLCGKNQQTQRKDHWKRIETLLYRLFEFDGEVRPPKNQQEIIEDLWALAADDAEYAAMVRAALKEWGLPPAP